MAFAENLKKARESRDVTQEELAKYANISQPMVTAYENGERVPNIFTGVKIARRLGTTCEELVK